MARALVGILVLIVSLWAVRSYRLSERNEMALLNGAPTEELEASPRSTSGSRAPAGVPADTLAAAVAEMPQHQEQKSPASGEALGDGNIAASIADLAQAFPARSFSVEDVRGMQREADRAEKEGLIQPRDRASYIRSLAQLRAEQLDQETDMMPDDMYDLPQDGGGFPEELE